MPIITDGTARGGQLGVDSHNSGKVEVYDAAGASLASATGETPGTVTRGLPVAGAIRPPLQARAIRTDNTGTMKGGNDVPMWGDPVEGATANTNMMWVSTATTQTAAQANNVLTLNSAMGVATTTGIFYVSMAKFPRLPGKILLLRTRARMKWGTEAPGAVTAIDMTGLNTRIDIGFGTPSSATSNTPAASGAYFSINTAGNLQTAICNASSNSGNDITCTICKIIGGQGYVETTGAVFRVSRFYTFEVALGDDWAYFRITGTPSDTPFTDEDTDDPVGDLVYEGTMFFPVATGIATPFAATHVACFGRVTNVAASIVASQLQWTEYSVDMIDCEMRKPWGDVAAGLQRTLLTSPTAYTQLALYANPSVAPTPGTLVNTAALSATVGGQASFNAAVSGESDMIVFGLAAPSPYRMYVKSVTIDMINTVVAVATTSTVHQWGLDVNCLAQTEASGNHQKITLGLTTLLVGSAVGAPIPQRISQRFPVALVTEPGRFFSVLVKTVLGTATATEVYRITCLINGYFE